MNPLTFEQAENSTIIFIEIKSSTKWLVILYEIVSLTRVIDKVRNLLINIGFTETNGNVHSPPPE